ncbi:CBS domain-containing protein [Paraglaciecola sp.]|uniref:CBS domain-containing protein n=1 Tax=Paraglaciecola sp. TaxID=1920173 RepID=UPI003EF8B72C
MLVKNIMTTRVVTVELDDTLRVVKNIFERAAFHHLLAVENGKLYGVLSDRDLFKAVSPKIGLPGETPQDLATLSKKVHQIMSRKPISLPADADVYQAISTFNQHKISCIPIVDEDQHPVGIISWRDILRVIEENHNKKLNKHD